MAKDEVPYYFKLRNNVFILSCSDGSHFMTKFWFHSLDCHLSTQKGAPRLTRCWSRRPTWRTQIRAIVTIWIFFYKMWSFWSKKYYKFNFYEIQHPQPFCVVQCRSDLVGSDFLHHLLESAFWKQNSPQGAHPIVHSSSLFEILESSVLEFAAYTVTFAAYKVSRGPWRATRPAASWRVRGQYSQNLASHKASAVSRVMHRIEIPAGLMEQTVVSLSTTTARQLLKTRYNTSYEETKTTATSLRS